MFIKRGDGKILSVVEADEMTEEQRKAAAELVSSEDPTKQADSEKKIQGDN